MSTYTITGATGNTGKNIASKLLEEGHTVRVIGRSAERLAPLVEKGAKAHVGSLDDENFLTTAFSGADGVFVMIPPNLQTENLREYQGKVGEAISSAIDKAAVRYVVHLSSLGAHMAEGTGPITGLHDQEQRLNNLAGVNVLHLRPTFFMENTFTSIGVIKNMGVNGSAIRGDLVVPMIATKDIARFAAERLARLDFSGHTTRELHGQRDLSLNEVTKVLGKAIGKEDLSYVQFPYEDAEKGMTDMGVSPSVAHSYIEMSKGFNDAVISGQESRSKENTTETSIEEFANVFAAVYKAG